MIASKSFGFILLRLIIFIKIYFIFINEVKTNHLSF